VVSGIGTSPTEGFKKAGLDVYVDANSTTVKDAVDELIDNKLKTLDGVGTCSTN